MLAFLAFAVASATGGVLYQRNRSDAPLNVLGRSNARLVLHAPRVNWLRLEPSDGGAGETLLLGGQEWRVVSRREITAARGLRNIRYALLDRGTYDWDRPAGCAPQWSDVLEFVDGDQQAAVALSIDCPGATGGEARVVALSPTAVAELRKFFEEQSE